MARKRSRSSGSVVLATKVEAALPCEGSSETCVDDEKFEVSMGSSGSQEAGHHEVLRVLELVRTGLTQGNHSL